MMKFKFLTIFLRWFCIWYQKWGQKELPWRPPHSSKNRALRFLTGHPSLIILFFGIGEIRIERSREVVEPRIGRALKVERRGHTITYKNWPFNLNLGRQCSFVWRFLLEGANKLPREVIRQRAFRKKWPFFPQFTKTIFIFRTIFWALRTNGRTDELIIIPKNTPSS